LWKFNVIKITAFQFLFKWRYGRIISMSYIRHRSVWYIYMYVTFPTLNDNMADYQSQSPCRHTKAVLESFFVLCVYRPHDNGIGVASDKIRKSLLWTVSASSCYRKYKFVSAKTRRTDFGQLLSKFCQTKSWNQCVAYVFNLPMKTHQNAPFCI
jgi:hypothetical protein